MKRFWIVLLLVFLAVITLVTIFINKPVFTKNVTLVNHEFETGDWNESQDTLQWKYQFTQLSRHFQKPLFQETPDQYIYRDDEAVKKYGYSLRLNDEAIAKELGNYVTGVALYNNKEYENADASFSKIQSANPWVSHAKGMTLLKLHDWQQAEKEFLNIPEQPGLDTLRYSGLSKLYYYTEQYDKLYELLQKPKAAPYFSNQMKAVSYFKQGKLISYLAVRMYSDISYEMLLISLLMTLAWLVYMMQYQLFSSRQVLLYISCFAGSAVLAETCLIAYDFYHLTLHFRNNGGFINNLLYNIFAIGFIEESVKFLPIVILVLSVPRLFKDPVSIAISAGCAALGFSFLENQMYIQNYYDPYHADIISTRGITPLIIHVSLSVIASYGLIKMKFSKSGSWLSVLQYLAVAMTLHGLFDYFLDNDLSVFMFMSYIILLVALFMMNTVINNALNLSPFFEHGHHLRLDKARLYLASALVMVMLVQYVYNALYLGAAEAAVYLLDDLFPFLVLSVFFISGLSNMQLVRKHLFPLFSSLFKKNKFPFLTEQHIILETGKESNNALSYPISGKIKGVESFDQLAEYFLFQPDDNSTPYILRMRSGKAVKDTYGVLIYSPATTDLDWTEENKSSKALVLLDKARLRPEYIPRKFFSEHTSKLWQTAAVAAILCMIVFFYFYMNYTVSRKYLRRAHQEVQKKNLDNTLGLAKGALYFDEHNDEAYMLIAKVSYYLGSYEYAINTLNELKQKTGVDNGVTNYIKGKCQLHLKKMILTDARDIEESIKQTKENESSPSAMNALTKATMYKDVPDSCWYYIGLIQFDIDQYQKALTALETYQKLNGNVSNEWYLTCGICYYKLNKPGEALKLFNMYLEKNDKSGEAYYYKGLCLVAKNQLAEACTEFSNAVTQGYEKAENYQNGQCLEYFSLVSSDTIQN